MAILWLLIVCGIVMALQGFILGKGSLKKLEYERYLSSESCYVGDRIEMVEVIENAKPIPVLWLRLEAMLPSSLSFKRSRETWISEGNIYQNHTSLFMLPPRTRITRTHQIQCRGRGIYQMDSATMTSGDLFALYVQTRQLKLNKRLVVYPSLLGENELPASWRTWQGELAVRRWIVEDPFLITGIRNYAPGDSMNRIHWNASARTGELQVHKNGYSADPRAMICLNIEVSEQMWNVVTRPDVVEMALSYAATCAASLIQQGMAIGFGHNAHSLLDHGQATRVEPDYGTPHLEVVLEAMAGLEMKSRLSFHEYLRIEAEREHVHNLDYLLVTAHVSDLMMQSIAQLETRGHRVMIAEMATWKEEAYA